MDTTNYTGTLRAEAIPNEQGISKETMHTVLAAATGAAAGGYIPLLLGKIKESLPINQVAEESDNTPVDAADDTPVDAPSVDTANATQATTAWADEQIRVATGVKDEMSFSEAFASARAEVGPGGAFEWHGNIYGTYYATEWKAMSATEIAEYESHFRWNQIETPSPSSAIASHSQDTDNSVEVLTAEPEVEVLGVVHDYATDMNIGGMRIDGQDVFLLDVNGDLEFDYMASDLNHNSQLDEGEMAAIQGQSLSVGDLGGVSGTIDSSLTADSSGEHIYEV